MPSGFDIANAFATGLMGWVLALAASRATMMFATITTMRPRGPGRTRAS
ncbi:MAG TPA: hypothetical protein VFW47_03175 [Phenylobacterium sp.]|nr:hypothetical protein [Phenylobacterium sp.]